MFIVITTARKLKKLLNASYEKGLNVGYDIGYQAARMDYRNGGTILKGYNIEQEVNEILKRKGV